MAKTIDPPSLDEVRRWGATTDLVKAGSVFGIGRTKSYELAQSGDFPVRVIRIGRVYRVPVAELVALLEGATEAEVA
ncbi:DNA-binding protein [Amycolatopsis thailandensis]|uniref:DNA-binding protein n=1 Tax=Amycolatopsis thailandensis TaxID=589330 RepID=UPI0037AEE491